MRRLVPFAAFAVLAGCAFAAEPAAPVALTADQIMTRDIMAKVGSNQDRTEAARTRYIYQQHIRMVSRKPGGKVMCEEVTESRVSPQQKESQQQLLTLEGRYWQKGRYVHYTTLQEHETFESKDGESKDGAPKAGEPKGGDAKGGEPNNGDPNNREVKTEKDDLDGMDIDLVENLRKNLADDKSKDGLGKGLFPLTTEQQSKYLFKLEGQQTMNGRDVYRVSFRPKDKNDFD
jgi:hypothetical protein